MRTRVTLDSDVAAAVEEVRFRSGVGVSQAVNRLIRAGIERRSASPTYRHRSSDLGLNTDVANVGDVIEILDRD